MNIKPSGQQVEKWIAKASSEGGKILDPNKLAGLAAQWGAAQAQQTMPDGFALVPLVPTRAMEDVIGQEDWQWADLLAAANAVTEEQYEAAQAQQTAADAARVLEWMRTPNRKPANLAFTDGPERQAAYWIEIAQQGVAQQTTEPELPEAVAIRHSFDGYGWMYIDNGHGSGWRSGIDKANAEFMYTAAQMHDHYAAGVRAGAAGIPWRTIDSAPKDGKCLVLVDTDDGVLKNAEVL